jgi:hypothetical protein
MKMKKETTNSLKERIRLLKAEIDALQYELDKAETELFLNIPMSFVGNWRY